MSSRAVIRGAISGAVERSSASSPAVVTGALAAASAAVLLYFVWRSLDWPLIHDAALMHYIAWLIGHGAVPYRDTFDMNMPGVYAIHLAALVLGGTRDLVWRAFDLGWLGVTGGVAYLYCRPLGDRWAAAVPGFLFAIHHVSGGASLAGQRDFFLCVFLLAGAWGVARSSEQGGRLPPLVWAGLVLGYGAMVKPSAALFVLACAAIAAVTARRARRSAIGAVAVLIASSLVVPAAMLGWLAWRGVLGEFLSISLGWTLPFYSRAGGASPLRVLVTLKWGFLAALALLGATTRRPGSWEVRRWLAVAGAAFGFVHFALQGKGYDYHLYPLALFLCVLAAPALTGAPGEAAPGDRARWTSHRLAAVALVVAALVTLADRGVYRLGQPWENGRVQRVDAVVAQLRRLLRPGETIQVMGPPGGHVLLRLGLRQPTRFFTDFQFFLWTEHPRSQALQREFVTALEARPPAAIVIFPGRGAGGPYGRLPGFPAFKQFLDRRYGLAVEGGTYRIYTRRGR